MRSARIELDFVVPRRRPLWLGLLLLAVATGIGADLVLRWRDTQVERSRIEASQRLLNNERRPAKRAPVERLEEQAKIAESVVRQLTLPWATLIDTLEQAAIKDVAVLQMQPEAQQRLLRITAEARTHSDMLQYLRNLAAANALIDVHLLNHQVQPDDPQKPLQFSLQAAFRVAP